jgi:catechol 2,3-dioxygenase-like lactoylglutathione lyase family enzyme
MALGPVSQIHISVTDMERAVAFYRDVLGIPLLFQVPGQPMAFFDSGHVRLYLGVPEPGFTSRCVPYFSVDDIHAEHERLVAAGVPPGGKPHVVHRTADTELWMSSFTDPDGHHVIITQERPA